MNFRSCFHTCEFKFKKGYYKRKENKNLTIYYIEHRVFANSSIYLFAKRISHLDFFFLFWLGFGFNRLILTFYALFSFRSSLNYCSIVNVRHQSIFSIINTVKQVKKWAEITVKVFWKKEKRRNHDSLSDI